MSDYPSTLVPVNHVEPVPRRIRATIGATTFLDTTRAKYVWEWSGYPQYHLPLEDFADGVLVDTGEVVETKRGTARLHDLRIGDVVRPAAARVFTGADAIEGVQGLVRLDWDAPDAWYEEDEQVFVHPRSPYTRVDALRSSRPVRVELEGVVLAESASSVMVFETGLPTRHYLDRTSVDFEHLVPSDTRTPCPYKGRTSGYWSVRVGETFHEDLAWSYDFPTRQLLPIQGLIAFYDEKVDTFLDGVLLERPKTHFS